MKKHTTNIIKSLIFLFEKWSSEKYINYKKIQQSGSNRQYYRIWSENKTIIGVYNPIAKENIAFINFSNHFKDIELNVPIIYENNLKQNIYLIQDLGDTTLFSVVSGRKTQKLNNSLLRIYKNVIEELVKFQVIANKNLDYSYCTPRSSFDKQSIMWDLNYFKYYFIKFFNIAFDEQNLENDFNKFANHLLKTNTDYFLYRDFQSRNIMLMDNKPYFIDYQGGRKGALQYDLASLLFQAKINLSHYDRNTLLNHYIITLKKYIDFDKDEFIKYYFSYVLLRIVQVLGAYGYRGLYQKKSHFIQSIPFAINNLKWLLNNSKIQIEIPELYLILKKIIDLKISKIYPLNVNNNLTVTITSFSYKNGIPEDYSGNGGGFVFDCRSINNPGRHEKYKNLTGKDDEVINFFNSESNINEYLNSVYSLIDKSVENYISRKFTNLTISFGCTGGQHRSVYCADKLTEYLNKKFDVDIKLIHRELGIVADFNSINS
ncbi:MAG: phosphotransferase [Bacteroidales bacterium]|nr:phosphotransferase [Bacteroidales bacterium]